MEEHNKIAKNEEKDDLISKNVFIDNKKIYRDEKEINENNQNVYTKENKNNLISLENVDFSNNSQKINSPRSIKACLNLGIKPYELYKLSIIQFKEKYPDVMKLNEFLYNFRYEQEDKFRIAMIKLATEERNKIIEKEEEEKKVKLDDEKNKMLV